MSSRHLGRLIGAARVTSLRWQQPSTSLALATPCTRTLLATASWLAAALLWLTAAIASASDDPAAGGPDILLDRTRSPSATAAAPPPRIEQIVVTAGRRPLPRSLVAASVSVVDADTLELDQSRDVLEVLRDVPSFSVVQTGSRGGTTSLFVRGGEADHNLVLVDGVQVNRGGGSFDFSTLTTDGIERIEVIRGPAAALYGSDAVASVIHVITKRGEGRTTTSLRALTGSDRTHEVSARIAGGNDRTAYAVNVGRYATNGIHGLNNDAESSSFRGRLDHAPSDSLALTATSSYTASAFDFPTDFVPGVPGGFPPVDPDQGRRTFEWYNALSATWDQSDRAQHKLTLGYTRSRFDTFDGLDPIPSDTAERKSRQHEQRRVVDYQLSLEGPRVAAVDTSVILGLEYERETFDSSTIAPKPRRSFTQRRRNRATFAQLGFDYDDRARFTISARVDDNGELGTSLTPAVSLAYFVPETGTKLRAAYAKGFKAPSFRETFGTPGGTAGNPDLDPERSRSVEAGIDQSLLDDRASVGLTYFRTDFDDLITFVGAFGAGSISRFLNVQRSRSQGFEAEASLRLTPWMKVGAAYTLLRTRVLESGGAGGTAFVEGDELTRRPTHSGSFHVDLGQDGWNARLAGTLVGPRIDRDFGRDPRGARVRSKDYVKTDLSVSMRALSGRDGSETWLVMRAENIFDKKYEEAFGFRAPGRRVLVGVELRR